VESYARGLLRGSIFVLLPIFGIAFVGVHLLNIGHQTGSLSEYVIRPYGWLAVLLLLCLAMSIVATGSRLWLLSENRPSRVGAVLVGLAGLVLVITALSPTDPPDASVTTLHGQIHTLLGPVWVPLEGLGLLIWAKSYELDGIGWIVFLGVTVALWAFGFPHISGVVFGIDQRLLFLAIAASTFLFGTHRPLRLSA
jgi:Protein of unknown function (DUF998)